MSEAATDVFETIPSVVFDNRTSLSAIHFNTVDQHDQAFHVFVVRQAFNLGHCNASGEAALVELPVPAELAVEDRYFDNDGGSVAYESDLAPYKPKCDVIVNGTAHAPAGKPVAEFPVRLQLHSGDETLIDKALSVSGERWFRHGAIINRAASAIATAGTLGAKRVGGWRESGPVAISRLPLRYEYALGGAARISKSDTAAARVPQDKRLAGDGEDIAHEVHEENPVGKGCAPDWYLRATRLDAVEAPRISQPGKRFSVEDFWACTNGKKLPGPAGYGVIGRAWLPRRLRAGTFTPKTVWAEDEVPRLPADFDYGYWNCAPTDQQCPLLRYGEAFTLHNLFRHDHPSVRLNAAGSSVVRFVLPQQAIFLIAANTDGEVQFRNLQIDTVCIDTDTGRVDLVWRGYLNADGRFGGVRLMHTTQAEQIERLDAAESVGVTTLRPASQHTEERDG